MGDPAVSELLAFALTIETAREECQRAAGLKDALVDLD